MAPCFVPEGTQASLRFPRTHSPGVSMLRAPTQPLLFSLLTVSPCHSSQIAIEDPRALLVFSGYVFPLSRHSTAIYDSSSATSHQGPHIAVQRDVRGRIVLAPRARDGPSPVCGPVHAGDDRGRGARLVPKLALLHRPLPRAHGRVSDAHHRRRPCFQTPPLRGTAPARDALA